MTNESIKQLDPVDITNDLSWAIGQPVMLF